ncbi:hypothetical protein D9M70_110930 [compost metagenome]
MLHHLLLGQGHARLGNDENLDRLARLFVRHTDGRALQHARQSGQHVFELVRVHVETGHQDHVFLAIDNAHEAIGLDQRDVAGLQPAFAVEDFIRGFLALPVALHDLRPLHAQFADFAQRLLDTGIIDDFAQGRRYRNANGADLDVLDRVHRRHRAGFGHAVAFADGATGHRFPAFGRGQLQGHAPRQGDFQRGEVQLAEAFVVAQGHEQRVQANEAAELPLRQFLDHRRQIARVADQDVVVARQHHRHAVKGERIDVVQRQRRDQDLATFIEVGAHQRLALQHVRHQVAVGQHRALGHAGGAAGVLQYSDITTGRVGFRHWLAQAFAQHVVELDGLGQVIGRHHLLHVLDDAVDQQTLEWRQQVGDFGDDHVLDAGFRHHGFRQVRHVGQADQGLGTGVVELVFHFPRSVERVGVDHDQPGADCTEDGYRVLQHVGQLHGDSIAGLQIGMLLQVSGKRTGQFVQFTVGECLAQVAECRFVGEALAGLLQHCLNIRILVGIDVGSNPSWVLILPKVFDHGSPLLSNANSAPHLMRLLLVFGHW